MNGNSTGAIGNNAGLTIVAVGASAGGLEALQGLFGAVSLESGLAFVVVTHLAPHHASHMAELLGRVSALPVAEAVDGEPVEADHVYVIPPNRLMGIRGGVLHMEPAAPRPGILRAIDHFMCALAEDQQERCAGIVLSGADHDGTVGLKEIKAIGGLTLVQDPQTASFPSMPRSAIAAGVADQVLPVEQMGRALLDYLACARAALDAATLVPLPSPGPDAPPAETEQDKTRLHELLALVRARTGHDFRWYRPAMLLRRLRRRMGLNRIAEVSAYVDLLRSSSKEVDALVKDFLIGITEFFRDPEAWAVIEKSVIPTLLENRVDKEAELRVWTPGCATGEEAYSIAMVLLEQLGDAPGAPAVSVFATDVDRESLGVARIGAYRESIRATVPVARLARFFEKRGDRYVVGKALRDVVLFAPQNLVRDPPFSRVDLIICRNLLIYLEPAQQSRILELFHFSLNPGGVLFLGKSESLGNQAGLFEPVSREHRIFRRIGSSAHPPRGFPGRWSGPGGFLTPGPRHEGDRAPAPAEMVLEHLRERPCAASVLVNRECRALYFHGDTARYLQLTGEPTWDLRALVREWLRVRLGGALKRAVATASPVTIEAAVRRDHGVARVQVTVEPLADFDSSGLLMVCFDEPSVAADADGAQPSGMEETSASREQDEELQHVRSELFAALQEGESTSAELRVAHEEAMSMNEELQASNEELESSKEELQSVNEELSSVNSELQAKLAELERALVDFRNLMDNTRVPMLFLDRELRIRRFTHPASWLFSLLASDEGRPLRDIAGRVTDPDLFAEAVRVLEGHPSAEAEVGASGGEWFLRRILPFRGADERIDGVVVTYLDISALRRAAHEAGRLAAVLQDSSDAVIVHDFSGKILSFNRGAQRVYGYAEAEARGLDLDVLVPASAREPMQTLYEEARKSGTAGPVTTRRVARDGRTVDVSVTASTLRDESGQPSAILSTERDITDQLRLAGEARFREMADDIPTLLRIEDRDGLTQFVNRSWLDFTGETSSEALLGHGWLKYVHPQDLAPHLETLARARDQHRNHEEDLRLRRADGSYRWVRSTGVARHDESGRLTGYVSVAMDTSERKLAEQGLAEAYARKDEFLAMLAHELRGPLAPIRNAVSVIRKVVPVEPRVGWAAEIIARQSQQLARLVEDLMDMARISSGKLILNREPIELSVLLGRSRESGQPLIEARNQHMEVKLPDETVYVEGDLIRLNQVIGNLLNNASKYTSEGGTISVVAHATEREVEISVTDDGAGISPDMLPRVFDLFTQADATLDRSLGGLGIGLALVRRLVELHGGTVEAHSEGTGHGSRFTVRLPRLALEQRPSPAPVADDRTRAVLGRRVLLVDDDVDSAESGAMVLELAGHTVRVAHDGASALDAAALFRPEVVVLDIGLPGMSGYEVARQLRGRRETASAVLIALTGYGQPEDVSRSRSAGFDHHLVKPVDPERLAELVGGEQRSGSDRRHPEVHGDG